MIFFVDDSPEKSVYVLDDKRVVSTIYYLAIAISDAMYMNNTVGPWPKSPGEPDVYVKWIGKNRSNYQWAVAYLEELLFQYQDRFGERHKANNFIRWFNDENNICMFVRGERTEFPEPPEINDIELDKKFDNVPQKYEEIVGQLINNDLSPVNWWGH